MIGTSPAAYAFIGTCIVFLHSIVPISLLYCAFAVTLLPPTFRLPIVFELWFTSETIFWLCFFLPYRYYLQRPATHPHLLCRSERRKLVDRVHATITDPETFVRGWFKGARLEEIGRDDVKAYLAWAFLDRGWVLGEDEEEIEGYVQEMECMLQHNFQPGAGRTKSLRLTLDPVEILHRSLLWYLCVGIVDFLAYLKLQYAGFHFHRLPLSQFFNLFPFRPISLTTPYRSSAKHLTYWHRPHTSTTHLPVLFIHGIGIGLYPYTRFLSDINTMHNNSASQSDGQIGILAIEIMQISFRISHPALSKEAMLSELLQILNAHNFDRFVLVSHSYGSIISTHIISDSLLRLRASSVLFIDPVSFLLHTPDVAYNFTVRRPWRIIEPWRWQANEWQLWFFASKDPGVAHALGRRFFWSQNVMWKEDVEEYMKEGKGKRVTVSLGGRDLIVNTDAVGRYVAGSTTAWDEKSGVNGGLNGGLSGKADSVMKACARKYGYDKLDAWKDHAWTGKGLEVLWFDNLDHAQVFDKKATRARLVKVIREYCKTARWKT